MQNRVKLKKSQLDRFRMLARNSPNEIQAFLIGEVISPTLTVIDSFEYPREYEFSTPDGVQWRTVDYARVQAKADALGKRVIGQMHSHPDWDAVLSPQDYDFTITYGYRVCGICSTSERKTRPRFWVMDSALECIIDYAKTKHKAP